MTLRRVVCDANLQSAPADGVGVALFAPRLSRPGLATIGHQVATMRWKPRGPAPVARDFMSIVLAVVAADTFVRRDEADDRWSRRLLVQTTVSDPDVWDPHLTPMQRALAFLTGDQWTIQLRRADQPPPLCHDGPANEASCVCLFSGGLDSTAGLTSLLASGSRPMLASHAYPRDGAIQAEILQTLSFAGPRLAPNFDPVYRHANETSMRGRSLGFIALGCLGATSTDSWTRGERVTLHVPENGFIAINPPLTPRRVGAHSTRTTHPAFLAAIQAVLDGVGMRVDLLNMYEGKTKGEVLAEAATLGLTPDLAATTVSCGKWKRKRQQCGRCVPCLIRRAAFHAAGMDDRTDYRWGDLRRVLSSPAHRDDLMSMATASQTVRGPGVERWARTSGLLPSDVARTTRIVGAVGRGIDEVHSFLRAQGVL